MSSPPDGFKRSFQSKSRNQRKKKSGGRTSFGKYLTRDILDDGPPTARENAVEGGATNIFATRSSHNRNHDHNKRPRTPKKMPAKQQQQHHQSLSSMDAKSPEQKKPRPSGEEENFPVLQRNVLSLSSSESASRSNNTINIDSSTTTRKRTNKAFGTTTAAAAATAGSPTTIVHTNTTTDIKIAATTIMFMSSSDPMKIQECTSSTHDTSNITEKKSGTTTIFPVRSMLVESKKHTGTVDGTEDSNSNHAAVPAPTPVPSYNNEGTGISTGAAKENTNQSLGPPGTATEQQQQKPKQDNVGSTTYNNEGTGISTGAAKENTNQSLGPPGTATEQQQQKPKQDNVGSTTYNNEGTGISTGAAKENTNQSLGPPGTATEQQQQKPKQDNVGSTTTVNSSTKKHDDDNENIRSCTQEWNDGQIQHTKDRGDGIDDDDLEKDYEGGSKNDGSKGNFKNEQHDTPGDIRTQNNHHGFDNVGGTFDGEFGDPGGYDDDGDTKDVEITDGKNEVELVIGAKASNNQGGDQHKDSSHTAVSNVIKQASRANDNRNSDGSEPSRKELESNVVAACKYFIKKRFLLNFKHITRDNIQNPDDDYTRLALAIGDFARARDRPQNQDDYSIICDQLRHLRVTDIRGIIAKVFDVMKHTLYIDTPLKKRYKQITIISKHDGTWHTSEIVYVSNQFKASKTENWDFDCGDTVFINGGKKFIVTYLLLQNKNGKFLEITKTKDMDYRYYQVNGGKSCTVKQLQCRYKTYGIVLIHYDAGNEFTKDLADDCGGCKEILETTRAADKHDTVADTRRFDTEFTQNLADNYEGNNEVPVTTEVADHDNRGCFPAALTLLLNRFGFQCNSLAVTLYCQHVGIDWKDGDSIPFALLEDALQKRTDLESPGENMHFEKINHFLRKNAMIFVGEADPLGEEDRLKRQILKGEDVNKYKLKPRYKHYITHGNNIWEKEDGIFFVLVKYRDENEDESTTPAENRHVLLFDAKNRFVGDKDDNFELTVEEGEDDDQVQQKLKDLWKEQYLTFTVANVWEFKKKQNQKQS